MGIAALVQVVPEFFRHLLYGILLRFVKSVFRDFLPVVPPRFHRGEMFQLHRFGFAEMLVSFRHVLPVEPCRFRGLRVVKEQDICRDAGIGGEYAARHPDDGVQVEFTQQFLFDADLRVVRSEQEAVRQDHRGPAVLFQPVHNHGHEQVRGLAARQVIREMVLDIRFFTAAVGGIHQDDVKLIVFCIIQHIPLQAVVVINLRNVNIVQQHVCHTQHIWKLLLFDAVYGFAVFFLIVRVMDLWSQCFQPAGQETAGTAGKVRHLFPDLRFDHLCHKISNSTGRIEFTG